MRMVVEKTNVDQIREKFAKLKNKASGEPAKDFGKQTNKVGLSFK